LSSILEIASVAGSATLTLSVLGGLALRSLKHAVRREVALAIEPVSKDVNDLKLKFAAETGGNSNGLRQKINEMDGKLDLTNQNVASVKGAFDQHILESKR
jgi:hypothetical protein